jgi:hypothetical protein
MCSVFAVVVRSPVYEMRASINAQKPSTIASEQTDPPRHPDWMPEDVFKIGMQNPSRVPHDVNA